jgi:hypothetical protein
VVGQIVTDDKGSPIDGNGNSLAVSAYNPPDEIKKLFARVQTDYQTGWSLQNRSFDEFDGYSLLQRADMDQKTFGAFVGAEFVPQQKRWRWKGRKNTARNMIIGILAHVIAGMLFPFCDAYNDEDEEDKMTAKVMQILIENHLKKAGYEIKFLFMMTSALVNPAVFVSVEYVEAMQKIKIKNADGSYKVEQAVDELLSGLNLNIWPIDSVLLGDFYTFDNQRQPFICKVRRISYDQARGEFAGKCFIDTVDQFDFVRAGMTRIVMSGTSNQTIYDIDWTEADANFVQIITMAYRPEDLEVTFVGGVFIGEFSKENPEEIYNSNAFKHRRMSMIGDKWVTIPVYDLAKSGFEPLDPSGRFAYYKSAAFKEFWDDASQNRAYQLAQDGMSLDVMKPVFLSGVAKVDSTVMMPGATIGMPAGAQVTPYQLGPNITAALDIMRTNINDMSVSTQDQQQSGVPQPGVTATASIKAEQNAKVILGVFGVMIADLVKQVGQLTIDCLLMHTTVGEIDATIPDSLNMKFQKFMFKGKEGGKDITNRIEFTNDLHGITKDQADKLEWQMFKDAGGVNTTQMVYKVNPYKFARTQFSLYVDADQIISRSMGTDQLRKERAFNILMDPRVMPFIDPQAVVEKFVLEEYSDGDPDEFKRKTQPGQDPNALLNSAMGQQSGQPNQQPGIGSTVPPQNNQQVQ